MATFTAAELAAFDGKDGKPVYIALKGQVFDVSAGSSFYGPGGPYSAFAGRECARALASMQLSADACTDDLEGLTEKQLETLEGWVRKFTAKYTLVGTLAK